jgi:hypothetical protein
MALIIALEIDNESKKLINPVKAFPMTGCLGVLGLKKFVSGTEIQDRSD